MKNRLIASLTAVCIISIMILTTSIVAQPSIPDITGAKQVSLKLACKLTLIQGDKASLKITGDEDALEDIQVKMIGDKLKIYDENRHRNRKNVDVTITLPELEDLSIEGAVDIFTPSLLKYNDLNVEVSGVADFDMKVKTKTCRMEVSGVMSGSIQGETNDFKIEISGVGKLDATDFITKNCNADVSGVATISVNVDEQLEADISGMGRINYMGKAVIRANSSGIGRVKRL